MTAEDLDALDASQIAINAANPKSPAYFAARFLRHPFYRYSVFLIEGPDHGSALLATRIAQHESARALRIVDFAGDPAAIASMGGGIATLLQKGRSSRTFGSKAYLTNILQAPDSRCLTPTVVWCYLPILNLSLHAIAACYTRCVHRR